MTDTFQPCPYCLKGDSSESKDHIFPDFLGGTTKISSCKKCNNTFGHTFEANAAKILQPIYFILAGWGVSLKKAPPPLKVVNEKEGRVYNLLVTELGMRYSLAKPVIERNKLGEIQSGEFVETEQAQEFVKTMIEKGKAEEMMIENIQNSPAPKVLDSTFEIGPDLRRLALKMCISLSTRLADFDPSEVEDVRSYLVGENSEYDVDTVLTAFDNYDEIDCRRKGLSHVIYVERGQTYVSGLVQFYGFIQFFCHLGISKDVARRSAVIATLDPLTREEQISDVTPFNLEEPAYMISADEYRLLYDGLLNKFKTEALARGGIGAEIKQGNSFHK